MDLFVTDFSNGYQLSSKGIKIFLEMPFGAEKKSQATDNRFKKSFIWVTGQQTWSENDFLINVKLGGQLLLTLFSISIIL